MGVGVPQDDAEGVRWYRLAADQSYVPALTNLGNMYETGEGVPQDYGQAYVWYDLAASQLCCQMLQRAIEHRYRVGGLMNSTQVAEARRLASEWDAAHPHPATTGVLYIAAQYPINVCVCGVYDGIGKTVVLGDVGILSA